MLPCADLNPPLHASTEHDRAAAGIQNRYGRITLQTGLHVQFADQRHQPPGRAWLRPSALRAAQRFLSADVDSTGAAQEVHSIGPALSDATDSLATEPVLDAVKEDYDEYKRQST